MLIIILSVLQSASPNHLAITVLYLLDNVLSLLRLISSILSIRHLFVSLLGYMVVRWGIYGYNLERGYHGCHTNSMSTTEMIGDGLTAHIVAHLVRVDNSS